MISPGERRFGYQEAEITLKGASILITNNFYKD